MGHPLIMYPHLIAKPNSPFSKPLSQTKYHYSIHFLLPMFFINPPLPLKVGDFIYLAIWLTPKAASKYSICYVGVM